jgi:hypothetical protein
VSSKCPGNTSRIINISVHLSLAVFAHRSLNGHPGLITHRRLLLDNPVGTEVRQKPGPLQTIFELPPDEVVLHSFSCALERSFLYHGRVYLSAWNICFHSNVFAKQMKVILPYENIEEIKRSQHAIINPAITITLRSGSGGQGVPPLVRSDGNILLLLVRVLVAALIGCSWVVCDFDLCLLHIYFFHHSHLSM